MLKVLSIDDGVKAAPLHAAAAKSAAGGRPEISPERERAPPPLPPPPDPYSSPVEFCGLRSNGNINCLGSLAPMWRLRCSTTQATFTNPSATPLLRALF